MTFPRLSIAGKLYAIFGLLASATVGLALVGVIHSRQQAAITDQFESAFHGSLNVERVNALIYAVVMESRGVYMSPDVATAKRFGDGLLKFNARIGDVVKEWQQRVGPKTPPNSASSPSASRSSRNFAVSSSSAARKSARRPAANGATTKPTAACGRR